MCFDIDVEKLSLQSLREFLSRISSLLTKPTVVARLPDQGYMLRQAKLKLQKEIKFREDLNTTLDKVQKMSLKCASETDITNAHSVRLCSLERREPTRYRPNLAPKALASGQSESMGELQGGVKLIDLPTSLTLQRKQAHRTKAEQMKAKQNRLMRALEVEEEEEEEEYSSSTDSDSDPEYYLDDSDDDLDIFDGITDGRELEEVVKKYVFDERDETDPNQPGPSGVRMVKVVKKAKPTPKEADAGREAPKEEVETGGTSGVSAGNEEVKEDAETGDMPDPSGGNGGSEDNVNTGDKPGPSSDN